MTAFNDTFHPSHRPWRIRRRPKSQPVAAKPVRGNIGPAAAFLCFILALLTVLSTTPAFLLFCACELEPACLARSFGNFLVGPLGVRKPAIVIMLAPFAVLLAYVVVFLRCHRRRDVLDFTGRPLGGTAAGIPGFFRSTENSNAGFVNLIVHTVGALNPTARQAALPISKDCMSHRPARQGGR